MAVGSEIVGIYDSRKIISEVSFIILFMEVWLSEDTTSIVNYKSY